MLAQCVVGAGDGEERPLIGSLVTGPVHWSLSLVAINFSPQDILFVGLSLHRYKVRKKRWNIVFVTFILLLASALL